MSNNRSKAEKLAQISLDEIDRSSVCFRGTEYFFHDSDFNKLNDLESQIRIERGMGINGPVLSDGDIKIWEKLIIDYCEERDRLLSKLGTYYSNKIEFAESELETNVFRGKRLLRDYELSKLVIANPMDRDKKMLSKLSDINDLSDYSNMGATAALKGLKAGKEVVYDKVKGDIKDELFISQGDIIDKGLENFATYNSYFYRFNAMKQNLTVFSKEDFLKKAQPIINERHAILRRIAKYKKKMQPAEWLAIGTNTPNFNAYPFY